VIGNYPLLLSDDERLASVSSMMAIRTYAKCNLFDHSSFLNTIIMG
jgi:hypothetical protein